MFGIDGFFDAFQLVYALQVGTQVLVFTYLPDIDFE